jgi:hypothetical protein
MFNIGFSGIAAVTAVSHPGGIMQEQFFSNDPDLLMVANVLAWLSALPLFVHVLLAAAVIALIGAAIYSGTSRAARSRAERDHHQRVDEREFALRRDLYPAAAEAIARAQDFLARFPGGDLSKEAAQAMIDQVMGALGRVHLVASESTLKATMALAHAFNAAYLELTQKRQPLVELQNEIDSLGGKISHLSYERDQLLASITRMSGDGMDQHAGIWGDMNMRFDKLHREIANLTGERSDKIARLTRMRRELAVEGTQASLRLAKLGVPAYLALRQELGMPVEEMEYRTLAQRNIAALEQRLHGRAGAAARPDQSAPKVAKLKKAQEPAGAEGKPEEARLKMVLKRS